MSAGFLLPLPALSTSIFLPRWLPLPTGHSPGPACTRPLPPATLQQLVWSLWPCETSTHSPFSSVTARKHCRSKHPTVAHPFTSKHVCRSQTARLNPRDPISSPSASRYAMFQSQDAIFGRHETARTRARALCVETLSLVLCHAANSISRIVVRVGARWLAARARLEWPQKHYLGPS